MNASLAPVPIFSSLLQTTTRDQAEEERKKCFVGERGN